MRLPICTDPFTLCSHAALIVTQSLPQNRHATNSSSSCSYISSKNITHTHMHTSLMALFSGTTRASRYLKGKTNLDFTEARDSEWQWHQLGHMQVCTSLQTDNHTSTPPLSFLQAGCPSCRPTNSVKALKAQCPSYQENKKRTSPSRATKPVALISISVAISQT